MYLQEAKISVLNECNRERKITIRNLIVIAILIIIAIILILSFAMPFISKYIANASGEINNNNFGGYYKMIIPIALLLCLFYPVMRLIQVFNRSKNAQKAFDLLSEGKQCKIVADTKDYITVIPLGKIKIQLNPIYYVTIAIDTKNYVFPIDYQSVTELKRALSNTNLYTYERTISQIYGQKEEISSNEKTELKSLQEFQKFAQEEFSSEINSMENERSRNKNMFFVQAIIAVIFVAIMVFLFATGKISFSSSTGIFIFLGVFFGGTILYGLIFRMYAQKTSTGTDYTQLKSRIFSRLVRFINPSFQYIEKSHISTSELLYSNLFRELPYDIIGGDHILGNFNGVPFQSCNVTVSFRPNFRSEKEGDDIAFSGNYFVARFPKKFDTNIVIHPKKGFFGGMNDNQIGSYLAVSDKIRLEDPDFQKQFEVYCDDQIQARYILTPVFMEKLKKLNQRNKGEVYIAINQNTIVIATNVSNALNRVDSPTDILFTKIDMNLLNAVYQELTEQLQMIEILNLDYKK